MNNIVRTLNLAGHDIKELENRVYKKTKSNFTGHQIVQASNSLGFGGDATNQNSMDQVKKELEKKKILNKDAPKVPHHQNCFTEEYASIKNQNKGEVESNFDKTQRKQLTNQNITQFLYDKNCALDRSSSDQKRSLNNRSSSMAEMTKNEKEEKPGAVYMLPAEYDEVEGETVIDDISDAEVKKLLNWIFSLGLIQNTEGQQCKLPVVCKNGEILFDLINRLEYLKISSQQGFYKNATKKSEIRGNYHKIMKHLSQYEKFNPRYLNARYYLMNGHYQVFWGFIYDIYSLFNSKISNYDRRYQNSLEKDKEFIRTSMRGSALKESTIKRSPQKRSVLMDFDKRANSVKIVEGPKDSFVHFDNNKNLKERLTQQQMRNSQKSTHGGTPHISQSQFYNNKNCKNLGYKSVNRSKQDRNKYESLTANVLKGALDKTISPALKSNLKRPDHHHQNHQSSMNSSKYGNANPYSYLFPGQSGVQSMVKSNKGGSSSSPQKSNSIVPGSNPTEKASMMAGSRYITLDYDKNVENANYVKNLYNDIQNNKRKLDQKSLVELEKTCQKWLEDLELKQPHIDLDRSTLFKDNLRNGYLLCAIIAKIYKKTIPSVCVQPKSIKECSDNIEKALNILRENPEDQPYDLLWKKENILKGDGTIIYSLLLSLKDKFESNFQKLSNTYNIKDLEDLGNRQLMQVNSCSINNFQPYSLEEIEVLKESIMLWVSKYLNDYLVIGSMYPSDNVPMYYMPTKFEEIIDFCKNGTLLIKLCNNIFHVDIKGIHRRPVSYSNFVHNVRKVLDFLKNQPAMSKKFVWKVKEIVDGNELVILGLLEDQHRFSDGLPIRKNPFYFEDGPYQIIQDIGGIVDKCKLPISNIDNSNHIDNENNVNLTQRFQLWKNKANNIPGFIQDTKKDARSLEDPNDEKTIELNSLVGGNFRKGMSSLDSHDFVLHRNFSPPKIEQNRWRTASGTNTHQKKMEHHKGRQLIIDKDKVINGSKSDINSKGCNTQNQGKFLLYKIRFISIE